MSDISSDLLGNAVGIEVDSLVKGIKGIVDVVLKEKGNAEAGADKRLKMAIPQEMLLLVMVKRVNYLLLAMLIMQKSCS
ncbi:hypothetical protein BHO_0123500 (plasmid) [Borrelia hermsii YBT]|uniref:Variable large protein n=1 Tax=Borrelia hermsii YBT TaxID=1313295 RepID=W5T238_BORHE|nr:hypothetical protein BHO_0123500 [Borrelia hermsii YBT]